MTQTHLNESAGTWDSESGAFISAEHQRLAEVLRDYNPYFSLSWIPPRDRDATDTKPFAIIDSSPGRPSHVMRYLSDLEMRDVSGVLEWVFQGDLVRHGANTVFARIQAKEAARDLLEAKKEEDRIAEQQDMIAFAARTPLHKFSIGQRTYSDY